MIYIMYRYYIQILYRDTDTDIIYRYFRTGLWNFIKIVEVIHFSPSMHVLWL